MEESRMIPPTTKLIFNYVRIFARLSFRDKAKLRAIAKKTQRTPTLQQLVQRIEDHRLSRLFLSL
eukprot:scaffold345218_cov28-Attheya_sp.AAC.1